MSAKGDVRTISNIIIEAIQIHFLEHFHDHETNKIVALGDEHTLNDDDNVEQGYYGEDEEFNIEYEKTMQNLSLMENL